MLAAIRDLEGLGRAVVLILGLAAIIAPFLNRFAGLRDLQFGYPKTFNTLAELATVGALISVFNYRRYLDAFPPFWLVLVVGIGLIVGCIFVASKYAMNPRSAGLIVCGGFTYVFGISLIFLGFAQISATMMVFSSIEGRVSFKNCAEPPKVYLILAGGRSVRTTRAKGDGGYRFWVLPGEYDRAETISVGSYESMVNASVTLIGADACPSDPRECTIRDSIIYACK